MINTKKIDGGILAPDTRKATPMPTMYLNGVFKFTPPQVVPVTYKRYRKYSH